jgi:LytR cell envelope-related transcriptional attenuator
VTVQVLNASGRGKADNAVIDELQQSGFDIVAVNPAAKIYTKTTVFWSKPSGKPAAQAMAQHFHWKAGPRPHNLSKSVTTHVVVGEDES